MKAKALIFALLLGFFSLSGCVASLGGPGYGHYPPAHPYYAPRPVIVAPQHGYYRGGNGHHGEGGYYRGGGYGGGHSGGGGGHHGRD